MDGERVSWGFVEGDMIRVIPGTYDSLAKFLAHHTEVDSTQGEEIALASVRLLSPITSPARIICQGANYSSHRAEAGMQPDRPPFNLIFTKADSSLSGPTDNVVRPTGVRLLDYEIELGLVIKKAIQNEVEITTHNFTDYVAGVVIANDISARDVQLLEGQWFKGKSFRTFCPTGPYLHLLSKDEGSLVHDLELRLYVNQELRQSAHTSQLLFKPEETLTELSKIIDLHPGDLVLTGTPGGVALNLSAAELTDLSGPMLPQSKKEQLLLLSQEKRDAYLREGDEIVCEAWSTDKRINLGTQRNKVV